MKTLRYKFDELWLVAINHTDMAPSLAELIIRNYIEEGIEPESDDLTPGFRGVWTLIKAQIDQRKRRNLRARERRQERREERRQHDTAKPSIATVSVEKSPSAKERVVTVSSSTVADIAPMLSSIPSVTQIDTLSNTQRDTHPSPRKVPFASRFRGPGIGAIRR